MFDHVTITVQNYEKSRDFYEKVLGFLGVKSLYEEKGIVTGFGSDRPMFWVAAADEDHLATQKVHVAFECKNHELVDEFHRVALEAGATDNGAPGLRPEYHKNYYAAFVLDPDGNNIEAVCRT